VSDIAERLQAAIGAKEVLALATSSLNWKTHDTHCGGPGGHCAVVMSAGGEPRPLVAWLPTFKHPGWDVPAPWANATFIADNDPASVLRDCAADREIVEWCEIVLASAGPPSAVHIVSKVMKLLARGYGLEVGQ
jgi:hypothetical protein